MTIWKSINGYEGLYEISTLGEVKSFHNGNERLIKCTIHKQNGYAYFQLVKNKEKKSIRLHKAVMVTFIGESNKIINHKNGDKTDNRLDNLEYISSRENTSHYWKDLKLPGVYYNRNSDKYRARIYHNGKSIHLGYFQTKLLAYFKIKDYETENKIENKYR